MYVLLTDILDTFGDLVFERIKSKGIDVLTPGSKVKTAASLPVNFTYMDVSPSAQETCRNWFYKTACIRELMPRLYVDIGHYNHISIAYSMTHSQHHLCFVVDMYVV